MESRDISFSRDGNLQAIDPYLQSGVDLKFLTLAVSPSERQEISSYIDK